MAETNRELGKASRSDRRAVSLDAALAATLAPPPASSRRNPAVAFATEKICGRIVAAALPSLRVSARVATVATEAEGPRSRTPLQFATSLRGALVLCFVLRCSYYLLVCYDQTSGSRRLRTLPPRRRRLLLLRDSQCFLPLFFPYFSSERWLKMSLRASF